MGWESSSSSSSSSSNSSRSGRSGHRAAAVVATAANIFNNVRSNLAEPELESEPERPHIPHLDPQPSPPPLATHPVGVVTGPSYDSFSSLESSPIRSEGEPRPSIPPQKLQPPSTRALAPDLLRGLLMALMALDHNVMVLHSWEHGTGGETEMDGLPVYQWNRRIAYVIRTLTHLCAPGFTFLLGMGVVYFGRSRKNLGWSTWSMARHFLVRAVVLTLISVVLGLALTGGSVWFMNIVLVALGVDYFLVGLLWLLVTKTEPILARVIVRWIPRAFERDNDDDDSPTTQPLLRGRPILGAARSNKVAILSADISWHIHNLVLFVLAVVTIWWNIWLSPDHGHCEIGERHFITAQGVSGSLFFRFWFYSVNSARVVSGFPPLGWISFAILGLVYGRIITARSWKRSILCLGQASIGLVFLVLFILTRVLRFGNLSEDCLQTPEHQSRPSSNPYLVSVQSFFYIVKYPPDVAFWAFTLALNLFLLAIFGAIPFRFASRLKPLLAFGTSALFFYIIHLLLLMVFGSIAVKLFGHDNGARDPVSGEPTNGADQLWVYFGNWAIVLALLYPACNWYSRFKRARGPDSIWRFF